MQKINASAPQKSRLILPKYEIKQHFPNMPELRLGQNEVDNDQNRRVLQSGKRHTMKINNERNESLFGSSKSNSRNNMSIENPSG